MAAQHTDDKVFVKRQEAGWTTYDILSSATGTEKLIIARIKKFKDPQAFISFEAAPTKYNYRTVKLKNGKIHADDGPAIVGKDNLQEWYQEGKLHRDDGPAKITITGTKSWWKEGVRQVYTY